MIVADHAELSLRRQWIAENVQAYADACVSDVWAIDFARRLEVTWLIVVVSFGLSRGLVHDSINLLAGTILLFAALELALRSRLEARAEAHTQMTELLYVGSWGNALEESSFAADLRGLGWRRRLFAAARSARVPAFLTWNLGLTGLILILSILS